MILKFVVCSLLVTTLLSFSDGTKSEKNKKHFGFFGFPLIRPVFRPIQPQPVQINAQIGQVSTATGSCHPLPDSGYCEASGDPHYKTFDGKKYDFMGLCTYDFVYTCGNYAAAGLKKFLVRTSHERTPGWGKATNVKSAALVVGGDEFLLDKTSVKVNGQIIHPPYKHSCVQSGIEVTISLSCGFSRIQTNFGLVIRYDRKMHVIVELSKAHKGNVCGLCGNFNGNAGDDFTTSTGQVTTNIVQFGNSHQSTNVVENKYCPIIAKPHPPPCQDNNYGPQVTSKCSILRTHPSFIRCHALLKPDEAIEDCFFDQCLNPDDGKLSCNIIERYARNCQRVDPSLNIDWVAASGCVPDCGPNQHYEIAATVCENTCANPKASSACVADKRPSCVCNTGYVRSGLGCIPASQCGCRVDAGQYHQLGESWLTNNCQSKATCSAGGQITTQPFRCPPNSVCKPRHAGPSTDYTCEANVLVPIGTCGAPPNSGTCSASGDPHYKTFDKRAYDFQGSCTYDFAYPCRDFAETGLPYFMIRTSNEAFPGWVGVTAIHTVTLTLKKKNFAISRTKVTVDGAEVHPPYVFKFDDDMQVTITKACGYTQISTDFGLLIRFDMRMILFVDVPRHYEGYMCGLCGNFNGDPKDDLTDKKGVLTTNIIQFANSYQSVGVVEMKNCKIVVTEPPPTCGTPAQKQAIEAKCSLLLTHPSCKQCHSNVPPQVYYADCVFDQCRDIANPQLSCSVIEHYALECKKRAEIIIKWKAISGCIPQCGLNEEYVEDTPICENTCGNLNARDFCTSGKQDGCVCKAGHVRSGLACVPTSNCGCTDANGVYHKVGDVWLSNNCRSKNTCSAPGKIDVLTSAGCTGNQQCQQVDSSSWQCVTIIPTCGTNEHYDELKPVCEDTCENPNFSKRCRAGVLPGCACDEGFIKNNGVCVPISECGCVDETGKYQQPGSSWTSSDCTSKFTCNGGQITTQFVGPCNGNCKPSGGSYICEIVVKPTTCTDMYGRPRPIGSSWTTDDCGTRYTCLASGETTYEELDTCEGECVQKNTASGVDYYCKVIIRPPPPPPKPTGCKDMFGTTRPIGSSWTTDDCGTRYTCLASGETTHEELDTCEGECVQKNTAFGVDYYCKVIIRPPPPPPPPRPTGCKDGQGVSRPLGASWRSSCCKFIYKCQCDGTVKTVKVMGCEAGSTCKKFTGPSGADYYCEYATDVCPMVLY